MNKQKKRVNLSLFTEKLLSEKKIIFFVTGAVVIIIAVVAVLLITGNNIISSEYSGAEVNQSVQLFYNTEAMGDFTVINTSKKSDGRYNEEIEVGDSVIIRQWRDFERPRFPCSEQIKEKFPGLRNYSRQRVPENVLYDECGNFTDIQNDKEYFHTVVLMRHGGWDYLVDVSVPLNERDKYSEFTDKFLNDMFFLG